MARHVHQQRDVAVGQRADRITAAQPVQPAHRIGPGHQPVPYPVQVRPLAFGQRLQAETQHQAVEDLPVQRVDVGPSLARAAGAVHRRRITGAPGIGKGAPVDLQALGGAEHLTLAHDRRAPVDDGAEDVEGQGAQVFRIEGRGHGGLRGRLAGFCPGAVVAPSGSDRDTALDPI